jgi:hypothetical protein
VEFTDQDMRDYIDWVATIDRDELPVPRVELERVRITRMPDSGEKARLADEFRDALLPMLMVVRLEEER